MPCLAHAAEPLRAGVLASAEPFVMSDGHGGLTGFSVELFRAIAVRMGRPIVFATADQPALIDGLAHDTYDVLPGPISATPDVAAGVLLTEGYAWSEFQFATRAPHRLASMGELRGHRLAVRSGSPYADWAGRNAAHYGFTVVQVASSADAAQQVIGGRADASLGSSLVQDYVASTHAGFVTGLSLPETRTHESAAVPKDDSELRDEVEDALRCLKTDGTVARLSKRWFGRDPDAEDLERLVVPGYGVPGLAGYDPKPRRTHC